MRKSMTANLRTKRKYLLWLKEAKGLSVASIDRAAASIDRYEIFTQGADFASFHVEKARTFKRQLESLKNPKTGKPLSASTVDGVLRDVKAFFAWLADQPGYRSKVSHADVAYLSPSRRTAKSAHGGLYRPHPTPDQILHVLRMMPTRTVIQRRDRAIIAMLYLTGARDGSLINLHLGDLDLATGCAHFRGVAAGTKFGKAFSVWFFPVGQEVEDVLEAWIGELRAEHLFGAGDPIFPKQRVGVGEGGGFQAQGLERAPWANATRVAQICKEAFVAAGLPPFTPHLFRKTLVDLANRHCKTPEDFKAWSQNLGHEDVLTTFRSYGAVSSGRQGDLIRAMTPVGPVAGA